MLYVVTKEVGNTYFSLWYDPTGEVNPMIFHTRDKQ